MKKVPLNVKYHNGVTYKYGAEWIKHLEELTHWEFYWCQQKLMEGLAQPRQSETVLEVGVGSGFAANYCRSKGFEVTTLDIDPDKKPDIIANVVDFEFKDNYDHLMAFEILEHMPYQEFEKIIRKLPQFVKRYAFISLPRNEKTLFSLNLKLPKIPVLTWEPRVPCRKISTEAHHWELDHKDTTTERVESLFDEVGFTIEKRIKHKNIRFYALAVNK